MLQCITLLHCVSRAIYLQIDMTKMKKMAVEIRKTKVPVTPISTQGFWAGIVDSFKDLAVHIDSKLD